MLSDLLKNIDDTSFYFITPILDCYGNKLSKNQINLINKLETEKLVVIKKARQVGASTVCALHIAKKVLNEDNYNVGIISSHSLMSLSEIELIKRAIAFLNPNINYVSTKEGFKLSNGSSVVIMTNNLSQYKYNTTDLMYLNEFSFIKNQKNVFSDINSPMYKNSDVIICSTPNGDDYFKKIYLDATNNENNFTPHNMPIDSNPKNTPQSINDMIKYLGSDNGNIEQEIMANFV